MKKIALMVASALVLAGCGNKQQTGGDAVESYAVQTVGNSSASLSTTYPATIKGTSDVEIRPKISGFITKIYVQEGQDVVQGQTLFTIDDVQYREAVKSAEESVKQAEQSVKTAQESVRQAEAQVNVVKANIATQQLTVQNKKLLYDRKIISNYDYDAAVNSLKSLQAQLGSANASVSSARAQVGSAQAAVSSAKAQLTSARDNLSYCTVKAPATGVIGMLPLKVGALVSPSMSEPFTTVSNINNVNVYFSMTEKQLLEMTRTANGGVRAAINQMPRVTLVLADGTTYQSQGKVDAVGGVIDQTTGSVQMRATFDNSHRILRSGGSGNIKVPLRTDNVIVVPQTATTEIQDKKYVFVVGSGNKLESREIQVEDQNDGTNYVVRSGLNPGDRIVIEGVQNLKSGMEIKPITPEQAAKKRAQARQDIKDEKLPG